MQSPRFASSDHDSGVSLLPFALLRIEPHPISISPRLTFSGGKSGFTQVFLAVEAVGIWGGTVLVGTVLLFAGHLTSLAPLARGWHVPSPAL